MKSTGYISNDEKDHQPENLIEKNNYFYKNILILYYLRIRKNAKKKMSFIYKIFYIIVIFLNFKRDILAKMKTHPLVVDDDKENIVHSLLRQVGSVHDNIAFVESIPSELTKNITSTLSQNLSSQTMSISFHQINYKIGGRTKNQCCHRYQRKIFPCCKPKPSKQILSNVSGAFAPGMNAILGTYELLSINIFPIFQGHLDVVNHLY
jgi:hypothetical protein